MDVLDSGESTVDLHCVSRKCCITVKSSSRCVAHLEFGTPSRGTLGAEQRLEPGRINPSEAVFVHIVLHELSDGRFGYPLLLHSESLSRQPDMNAPIGNSKQKLKLADRVSFRELGGDLHLK